MRTALGPLGGLVRGCDVPSCKQAWPCKMHRRGGWSCREWPEAQTPADIGVRGGGLAAEMLRQCTAYYTKHPEQLDAASVRITSYLAGTLRKGAAP